MDSQGGSKIFQWDFTIFNHTNFHSHSREVNATAAPSLGLDPHTINSLPIILQTNSKGKHGYIEETECSICRRVFEDEEKLKILPQCNHAYHSQCVDKWLGSQSSCPLCRACLTPITSQ